jgi:hypothetical protein
LATLNRVAANPELRPPEREENVMDFLGRERRDGIADPRNLTRLPKLLQEGVVQTEKLLARKTSALQHELCAVISLGTYNGSRHGLYLFNGTIC